MIAKARNISHGQAYEKYITRKDLAVFVGAKNMVANTDLFVSNDQLDDLWEEFEEAGRDYVRKGKDVTNNIIAIEYSPTMEESASWTKEQWFEHAEELLKEIDNTDHAKAKRDPKTKEWITDKDGKRVLFPVEHTNLCNSKWMAMLHRDSFSGIYHLHITVSRYTEDNKLNCVTDIAKRTAMAAEQINKRHGWNLAMDIRQQHIDEINAAINAVMAEMPGDKFDPNFFMTHMENSTFTTYDGAEDNYNVQFHKDENNMVDGYSIFRGKSVYTSSELGQKIKQMPVDYNTEIKDAIYRVMRSMDTPKFNWNRFIHLLEQQSYTDKDGNLRHYQFEGRRDPNGGYYNYSVIRDGKKYNASQIGQKLTAKKIAKEYEKEQQKMAPVTRTDEHLDYSSRDGGYDWRLPDPLPDTSIKYADVTAYNIVEVVREKLKEVGIEVSTNQLPDNMVLVRSVDDYLHDAVDYINAVTDNDRKFAAEMAWNCARYAAIKQKQLDQQKFQKQQKPAEQKSVVVKREPSEGERERISVIAKARETLREWCDSHKAIFSDEQERILGLGIGAKCIENGMSPWIDANMEGAARELADEAAEGVGKAALRMTQLAGEILMGIAVPQDVSLGSGGGSHNDLPKKKDDEWNRFKPAFGMRPKGRGWHR